MSLPPDNTPTELAAARAALAESRFQEALSICAHLTRVDRTNYEAWQLMGIAHAQLTQKGEAIEALRQCARLRPHLARPHFNLAVALLAAGQRDAARDELETCLTLDPTYTRASQALRQLGDAPGATPTGLSAGVSLAHQELAAQAPLIGQASQSSPMANSAAPLAPTAPASFTPGNPPPFNPDPPAQFAPASGPGLPGASTTRASSYGIDITHQLDRTTAFWLRRAAYLGGGLTLASIGSLIRAMSANAPEGVSGVQVALAILQIVLGAGMVIGARAVLNRREWGRKVLQIFSALGALIAGLTLIMMITSGRAVEVNAAVMGAHSFIQPVLWLGCCIFLFFRVNQEHVQLAMSPR